MRVFVNPFVLFQTAPGGVFAVPQQVAVDAVAVVVVAHQFLAVEGDGGEADMAAVAGESGHQLVFRRPLC